ncbi:hypothetical protein CYMTET_20767 [Cymbomonas tetramitiformis]|uniref:Uncharacterized protein n=1 Tax=Cymbomonas tetramitiformis TaxID=36881 RepID=A0AAE0G3M5_9CHLO|nr:hypothetical protein CYMTET_20767 [Cymbomonas tetramitiformis]
MVAHTKEEPEEAMMLLVEYFSFLGFKVNNEKCEGPARVIGFLGGSRSGVGALLYTRKGFAILATTEDRRGSRLPHGMSEDLLLLKRVVQSHNGKKEVQKLDGHKPWGNLPFSIMKGIVLNFLRCKMRQLWGTSCGFLVPSWEEHDTWELVKERLGVFKVVHHRPMGTNLFTAPDLRGELVQELLWETERCKAEALAPETRRCYGTGTRDKAVLRHWGEGSCGLLHLLCLLGAFCQESPCSVMMGKRLLEVAAHLREILFLLARAGCLTGLRDTHLALGSGIVRLQLEKKWEKRE